MLRTLFAVTLLALLCAPVSGTESVETMKKGVVKIRVEKTDGGEDTGAGNVIGVKDGTVFILTALHVVEDEASIKVSFYGADWKKIDAEVYRTDEQLDIAVLYLEPDKTPTDLP